MAAMAVSDSGWLSRLETALGAGYFLAWSVTSYPQVLLMHRRGTTEGLSPDFMTINGVGFIAYTIYTLSSYFVPAVALAYRKHTGMPPQVAFADVLFAAHGALMCTVMITQQIVLPPRVPPRRDVFVVSAVFLAAVLTGLLRCWAGVGDWFHYLRMAGYVKVLASLVKHFPQVLLNRERQSTVGWSLSMILLDILGGSLSMVQQVVRSVRIGSMAPFTSNPAKTFLAVESVLFDFFFVVQHMVWYTDRSDVDRTALPKPKTGGEPQYERVNAGSNGGSRTK